MPHGGGSTSTLDTPLGGAPLAAGPERVVPRSVKGRYRALKWGILSLAYGVYFLLPWLRWDRGDALPDQALLFDIAGRRFYLFDLVVHAQDIFWLAGFLMVAALLLFFVTGLLGRVFCGYFCFQTLWTDVFLLIERWVQGDRNARLRLAKAPLGVAKAARLGATHALWLLVAFATGLAFVLYWGDAPTLVGDFFAGQAPAAAYTSAALLTATTYVMAGIAREQVCTFMCPYARFQSVMFDRDTLIVAYDAGRGEGGAGRHKPTRGLRTQVERQAQGVGDCIDCGYCVQVCPTGIDIREGLQVQCISCALCVDACDTVMDAMGYARGLIRYTSERGQEGQRARWLRPKVLGYGAALSVAAALLASSIITRAPLELSVDQVRRPLFVTLSDGRLQNNYELRVTNKTPQTVRVNVDVEGLEEAELDLGWFTELSIRPEQRLSLLAHVRVARHAVHDPQTHFRFVVHSPDLSDATLAEHAAIFSAPR
jgi:cytochrome c oxidase accessory protein FixG